ncbi:MAG: FHA domain-containing protein [Verrucomicrobia bacterium]|nr:FHA domain-containing protein [Verrucomicrobiota bacterium]
MTTDSKPEEEMSQLDLVIEFVGDNQKQLVRQRIHPATYSIGSDPQSAIHIDDPAVSRNHAQLVFQPDGIWVEDLGSTNGTFVGDVRLKRSARLRVNQRICVGRCVFWLEQIPIAKTDLQESETFAQAARATEDSASVASDVLNRVAKDVIPMRRCLRCRENYPHSSKACPKCGCAAYALTNEPQSQPFLENIEYIDVEIQRGLQSHCARCGRLLQLAKGGLGYCCQIELLRPLTPLVFFIGMIVGAVFAMPLCIASGAKAFGTIGCFIGGAVAAGFWNVGMPKKPLDIVFCQKCKRSFRNGWLIAGGVWALSVFAIASLHAIYGGTVEAWPGVPKVLANIFATVAAIGFFLLLLLGEWMLFFDKTWFNRQKVRLSIIDDTKGIVRVFFRKRKTLVSE